jgi:hypothetical protein
MGLLYRKRRLTGRCTVDVERLGAQVLSFMSFNPGPSARRLSDHLIDFILAHKSRPGLLASLVFSASLPYPSAVCDADGLQLGRQSRRLFCRLRTLDIEDWLEFLAHRNFDRIPTTWKPPRCAVVKNYSSRLPFRFALPTWSPPTQVTTCGVPNLQFESDADRTLFRFSTFPPL